MPFDLRDTQAWTLHYVEHGFAHLRAVVGDPFLRDALTEVQAMLGHNLPPEQWTSANTPCRSKKPMSEMPVLTSVYDQPGIRRMIDVMFGSGEHWNGERAFQLFINPYNPDAKQELAPEGHLDFVESPIPVLGSGFMFQVSLVESEPFSGNLTIYPGTHKLVQGALAENPDLKYPSDLRPLMTAEPYEFVAQPGDVLLFHHLVGHNGNHSHATNRRPRLTLHCQGLRKTWLQAVDPADPALSPWERSLAFTGGPYRVRRDELEWIMEFRKAQAQAKAAEAAAKAR